MPNAGQGLKTLSSKASWNKVFERYLRELDAVKPVVWTGDINCVQEEKGGLTFSLVLTTSANILTNSCNVFSLIPA